MIHKWIAVAILFMSLMVTVSPLRISLQAPTGLTPHLRKTLGRKALAMGLQNPRDSYVSTKPGRTRPHPTPAGSNSMPDLRGLPSRIPSVEDQVSHEIPGPPGPIGNFVPRRAHNDGNSIANRSIVEVRTDPQLRSTCPIPKTFEPYAPLSTR